MCDETTLTISPTTNEELLRCPPLRWGILGCGRISHDFAQALKIIPSAAIVACAGRSVESAMNFADTHKISKFYGSYEDMLADEEVDVVYVGTIHVTHYTIGMRCLLADKNVLIEKPMACDASEVENLISLAKERNLFLMEAMWTRFFPAVEHARRLARGTSDQPGLIGDVVSVQSDFNFNASDCEEYPSSPSFNRDLGGGASYWIGSYPVFAATFFFGSAAPQEIQAVGYVDPQTGVDLQASISMSFAVKERAVEKGPQQFSCEEEKKTDYYSQRIPFRCGMASLSLGFLGESPQKTTVVGTCGRLTLGPPAHCPTELTLSLKGQGRGKIVKSVTYSYPLPEETDEIRESGGFLFPGSAGLCYQAAAVSRCIAASRTESPQFPLSHSLINARVLDEVRSKLGLVEYEKFNQ